MMKSKFTKALAICTLVVVVCTAALYADTPVATWVDADIGAPAVAGSHTFASDAFTLTGGGAGLQANNDQLHYTYRQATGDVEVIARISAFNGAPKSEVGIMLRSSNAPDANRAAVVCSINSPDQAAKGFAYTTYHSDRNSQGLYKQKQMGSGTMIPMPIWLRIDRVGNDYGCYRSSDGKLWTALHNDGGGPFFATGPIELGFFVAGGDPKNNATVTATVDNIRIGRPDMGYRTSWIGNTYSQDSTGFVTGGVGAMSVLPDGTVFTNCYWDEGGEVVKIYKDGKVVGKFDNEPFGNLDACDEGSVATDGTHMYLVHDHSIYQTDMTGQKAAFVNLWPATDLFDDKRHINVTSGMAVVNGLLYVSDSRDNKILVFDPSPSKFYYKATNSSTTVIDTPIDTSGVANAAPATVYQSQRECDFLPYVIPGLDPTTTYTVRYHFCDFKYDKPRQRLMRIWAGSQSIDDYDIAQEAGGKNKPAVLDMPNVKPDKNGNMSINLTRSEDTIDKHIVICGFEVIKPDGTDAIAVNCGGPAVGKFQSEVNEIPSKEFSFDRPGPIAADKRGNLWIIHEASSYHAPDADGAAHVAGGIECIHTDGSSSGKQITDVDNPSCVAYDSVQDRLLVSDNGPMQNLRFYTNLSTSPTLAGTFGARGGIYSGTVPGRLFDPVAGGWARFYQPNAVGIDAQGYIYVNCKGSGTDLRKFSPSGQMIWKLNALHFVDCADFDPDSDGTSIYTPYKHYAMDYSKTAPGSEWSYVGHNWNALKYGVEQRGGGCSAVVRRLGPKRALIMYTSGQGSAGYVGIYRFEGDVAVPCGKVDDAAGSSTIWIDKNGDGKEDSDEIATAPNYGGIQSFNVDSNGDIWIVYGRGTFMLHHLVFKGLNSVGAPIYDNNAGDVEEIAFPPTGLPGKSPWGQLGRVSYDRAGDVMYLFGPALDRKSDKVNTLSYIARYDNWSKGNRTAKWVTPLPDPGTDPNFMYAGTPATLPYGLAAQYMAFDVAGDKIFVAEMFGPIHVYDAATGKAEQILNAGPEVSGCDAWEDENMGIRAFKRANGSYVVIEENSGFRAKDNMFILPPGQ